jgi:hypothetical protein
MGLMAEAGFGHLELVPNPLPLHGRILIGRKTAGLPLDRGLKTRETVNTD